MTTTITTAADIIAIVTASIEASDVNPADFDVEAIVAEIGQDVTYGVTTSDELPEADAFWAIVAKHDSAL